MLTSPHVAHETGAGRRKTCHRRACGLDGVLLPDIGALKPLPILHRGGEGPMAGSAKHTNRTQADMADGSKKPSPGEFIRQVRSETSKVVWPTREETVRTAIFVGIMVTLLALFFLGVDSVFGALVRWLLTLA